MANVRKVYDAGVKVGEYQDRDGNTKGRWENIGAVFTNEKGESFMTIKKTFNPAGVPSNGDGIIISFFKPRSNNNNSQPPQPVNNNSGYNGPAQNWSAKDTPDYSGNSDIPF